MSSENSSSSDPRFSVEAAFEDADLAPDDHVNNEDDGGAVGGGGGGEEEEQSVVVEQEEEEKKKTMVDETQGARASLSEALPAFASSEYGAEGTLGLRVLRGKALRSTQLIGKQSPFVKLTFGSQIQTTSVHKKAGSAAEWNQLFKFRVVPFVVARAGDVVALGQDDSDSDSSEERHHQKATNKRKKKKKKTPTDPDAVVRQALHRSATALSLQVFAQSLTFLPNTRIGYVDLSLDQLLSLENDLPYWMPITRDGSEGAGMVQISVHFTGRRLTPLAVLTKELAERADVFEKIREQLEQQAEIDEAKEQLRERQRQGDTDVDPALEITALGRQRSLEESAEYLRNENATVFRPDAIAMETIEAKDRRCIASIVACLLSSQRHADMMRRQLESNAALSVGTVIEAGEDDHDDDDDDDDNNNGIIENYYDKNNNSNNNSSGSGTFVMASGGSTKVSSASSPTSMSSSNSSSMVIVDTAAPAASSATASKPKPPPPSHPPPAHILATVAADKQAQSSRNNRSRSHSHSTSDADDRATHSWEVAYFAAFVKYLELPDSTVRALQPLVVLEDAVDPSPFIEALGWTTVPAKIRLILMIMEFSTVLMNGLDARVQVILRQLAQLIHLDWSLFVKIQDSYALTLHHAQLEEQKAIREGKAKHEQHVSKRRKNWWKIGLLTVAGGAAVAFTGGLAAPAVGVGFAALGVGGASAFIGTAAGTALVTTVFGATGAGLVGKKASRRYADIKEFDFAALQISQRHKDKKKRRQKRKISVVQREPSLSFIEDEDEDSVVISTQDTSEYYSEEVDSEDDSAAASTTNSPAVPRRRRVNEDAAILTDDAAETTTTTTTTTNAATTEEATEQKEAADEQNDDDEDDEEDEDDDEDNGTPTPSSPGLVVPADNGNDDADTAKQATIAKQKRSMNVALMVSGWLDDADDYNHHWDFMLRRGLGKGSDLYTLRWETDDLLAFGGGIKSFTKKEVAGVVRGEVLKKTVLRAMLAAVAWPMTVIQAAGVIDNNWSIVSSKAIDAGRMLADVIQDRGHGNRPLTLVGFSMGARVIFEALDELAKRRAAAEQAQQEAAESTNNNNASSSSGSGRAGGQSEKADDKEEEESRASRLKRRFSLGGSARARKDSSDEKKKKEKEDDLDGDDAEEIETRHKSVDGIVLDVFLIGACVTVDAERWARVRSVVSGRLVNVYSLSDWVLRFSYRSMELSLSVAGLGPVSLPGVSVENYDCSHLVYGHQQYASKLGAILKHVHFAREV